MTRPKDSKNKATIVREYLHKKFADLTETNDIDQIIGSILEKAKEGNHASQKLVMENMDKIVQWEQKNEEGTGNIEIFIDRDGTSVRIGTDGMGGHNSKERVGIPEYKNYVGPLPNWGIGGGEKSAQSHFETTKLYKWGDELMGLADICREEGINYQRVYQLLNRYDISIEDAVQEIKDLTVIDDGQED